MNIIETGNYLSRSKVLETHGPDFCSILVLVNVVSSFYARVVMTTRCVMVPLQCIPVRYGVVLRVNHS